MSQIICSAVCRRLSVWSNLRQSSRLFSATPPAGTPKPTEAGKPPVRAASTSAQLPSATHKVDEMERKILVWAGKYKNANEIPGYVDPIVMERARSEFRIRIASFTIAFIGATCIYMTYARNRKHQELIDKKEVSADKVAAQEAVKKFAY